MTKKCATLYTNDQHQTCVCVCLYVQMTWLCPQRKSIPWLNTARHPIRLPIRLAASLYTHTHIVSALLKPQLSMYRYNQDPVTYFHRSHMMPQLAHNTHRATQPYREVNQGSPSLCSNPLTHAIAHCWCHCLFHVQHRHPLDAGLSFPHTNCGDHIVCLCVSVTPAEWSIPPLLYG